jgi:hypothetical protein
LPCRPLNPCQEMKYEKNAPPCRFLFLLPSPFPEASWRPAEPPADAPIFPPSLESYGDKDMGSIIGILGNRIRHEPFNLMASLIFLCAIIHTFLTGRFMVIAHRWAHDHEEKIKKGWPPGIRCTTVRKRSISWARWRRCSVSGPPPWWAPSFCFSIGPRPKATFYTR